MAAPDTTTRDPSAPSEADAELAIAVATEAASGALRAGTKAPLFTLADETGAQVALGDLLRMGPVVLHFIRGAWCSFSEQSLKDFAATHRQVVALGASAVAITPVRVGHAHIEGLPVRELQDVEMRVIRQFGLAFTLPKGLRKRYVNLGYSPPAPREAGEWLVPLPATYVLDRDGTVVLGAVDSDYRQPFDPLFLLTALKALKARGGRSPQYIARPRTDHT
ncbi:peroxiredoxin-like family protein [Variovorax sp. Sphag1AA]|uniref:peroxiredoxin-like family protein n=1 Tax=Variovorax sp. Sphag1AA TaxID=2587027 RepID=UPI0016150D1B|nr:peroxiredoxin-like family protein [Variovorax sp. Sphag1AA]MBB3178779.1 peroxiredoxin [Variovorax sp. Sphag1AA]